MDIKAFGSTYVDALVEEGYLHNYVDIYRLHEHRDELVEKGIMGKEKNTDKNKNVRYNGLRSAVSGRRASPKRSRHCLRSSSLFGRHLRNA